MVAILFLAGGWPSAAQEATVPPELQALILARVLAYDRNMKVWAKDGEVTIGLLAKEPASESDIGIRKAFSDLESKTIQELPLRVTAHGFKSIDDLAPWIAAEGIEVLYVPAGFDREAPAITALCKEKRLISMSPVESYVKAGMCLGLILEENKPHILVNLGVAKALQMNLDPKVLGMSEVIR